MRRSPALVACVALMTGAFIGASPAVANGPRPARIDVEQIIENEQSAASHRFPTNDGGRAFITCCGSAPTDDDTDDDGQNIESVYLDGMLVDEGTY